MYLGNGYPYVKLNEKVTVSSKGKLRDTSFVAWNDRWVKDAPTQSIEGEYQHSKIESAKATVTKTDKGYDVNWGDEVQSFTGKNAAETTQAALKKEGFSKKTPDNDNGGVPVEPVAPVTNSKYQNFNDFIEKIKPQLANKKLDAAWVIAGKKIKNELPIILEQVKPYLDGVDYEQAKGSAWKTPKVVGLPDLKIDASKRELSEDAFIFLIANELNKKGLLDFNAAPTAPAQTKAEKKTNPKPA